jgi:hypothetical protein
VTTTLNVALTGTDGLRRAVGIMAEALTADERQLVLTAAIRPTSGPGGLQRIVRKGFTLEEQSDDAFDREGRTALNSGWEGYAREPRYAGHKEERGGGKQVGIWRGAKRPLFLTFRRGHPEHIETVTPNGFVWGSRRMYAGRFHEGGFQPWDKVRAPARPIVVVNERYALEVARGYQRLVVYKLRSEGRSIDSVRVNL